MKKIIALVMSVALCFSCIACDSNNKTNTDNSNKKETVQKNTSKDNKKDSTDKESSNGEDTNVNNDKNKDADSNDSNNQTASNNDDNASSSSDSYVDVTKDYTSKIQGTWKESNSGEIFTFNSDETYTDKDDSGELDGGYWLMNNNNKLYLFIYAKGTAHPSSYCITFKDDNNIELVDTEDSTDVLELVKQ